MQGFRRRRRLTSHEVGAQHALKGLRHPVDLAVLPADDHDLLEAVAGRHRGATCVTNDAIPIPNPPVNMRLTAIMKINLRFLFLGALSSR